jgi:hypothetical protein
MGTRRASRGRSRTRRRSLLPRAGPSRRRTSSSTTASAAPSSSGDRVSCGSWACCHGPRFSASSSASRSPSAARCQTLSLSAGVISRWPAGRWSLAGTTPRVPPHTRSGRPSADRFECAGATAGSVTDLRGSECRRSCPPSGSQRDHDRPPPFPFGGVYRLDGAGMVTDWTMTASVTGGDPGGGSLGRASPLSSDSGMGGGRGTSTLTVKPAVGSRMSWPFFVARRRPTSTSPEYFAYQSVRHRAAQSQLEHPQLQPRQPAVALAQHLSRQPLLEPQQPPPLRPRRVVRADERRERPIRARTPLSHRGGIRGGELDLLRCRPITLFLRKLA